MKKETIIENQNVTEIKKFNDKDCAMTVAMNVIGGKWKLLIVNFIQMESPARFGALRRKVTGITQAMLTSQLRELEKDGILHRKVYAEVPPKVEYTLTELGEQLIDVSKHLRIWGNLYMNRKP